MRCPQEPALERKGVDAVLCITPDAPEAVQQLASAHPTLTSHRVRAEEQAWQHAAGSSKLACALHSPARRAARGAVQVKLAADPSGGFIRLLGLELGVGAQSGPKCQRFAGIVDNGVLLKVVSAAAASGAGGRMDVEAC